MSGSTSKVKRMPVTEAAAFGKYHLIAKLGQGGMADVFLSVARGPVGFNKLVVIKRLKDGVAEEAEFHGMFMDEARLAARLNHPNVVQTNEVGVEGGHHFLAMEFLEGQPLNRIMNRVARSGPLSPEQLGPYLRVVCDALAGLHYAHELCDYDGTALKVVHRDVSPHNVFVTYDGVAKVVDFGIAKAAVRSSYTSTGVVKGKISYMAPEQALSAPIDRRADVFSMGVILWELVAGERLWGTLTEVQILQKMAFGEMPRLKARRTDAPDELDRICGRALAMIPTDRYESAAAMRADIEKYMKDAGCTASVADVGALVSEMFKDRREEIRAVIQEQLKHLKDDAAAPPRDVSIPDITASTESRVKGSPPPPSPGDGEEVRVVSKSAPTLSTRFQLGDRPEVTPTGTGIIGNSTSEIIRPARPRRPTGWIVGAVGLVVAGIGVAALLKTGAFGGAGSGVGTDPSKAHQSATAAPNGSLVELKVAVTPPTAAVFIDNVQAPAGPFAGKFAADGRTITVKAEAPGMKPESRMVTLDRDQVVEITLSPESAPKPSAEPSASAGGGPRPGRPHTPKVDTTVPF